MNKEVKEVVRKENPIKIIMLLFFIKKIWRTQECPEGCPKPDERRGEY